MPQDFLVRVAAALADRYRIERELGRGSMAYVLLAEERLTGRFLAVKVLQPSFAASIGAERFLREIRFIAGLDHPSILPVLDCAMSGPDPLLRHPVRRRWVPPGPDRAHPDPFHSPDVRRIATRRRGGDRLRPRAERPPPRHQAGQHPLRPGPGRRLRLRRRPGAGRHLRCRHLLGRPGGRHRGVHEPGTGDRRQGTRPAGRRLLASAACSTRC